MPSTKRQRQRRERTVGDAAAAALFGEAATARANPDASLFFRDDADTETASKRARRVAKKKVATASSTESALTRKVERRRAARPAHAGAAAAAARATAAATAAARAAPPTEDLWGDTAEVGAADEWTAAPADGSAPATSLRARRRPRRAASAAAAAGDAEASGASYNPSKSSHRALLAEAEAVEAARRAAEDAETDWWAERDRRRLASEDKAEDDSASESASESDDGGENGADGARLHKSSRSLKKGRAQRNRMKRARLQAFEKTQRDDSKRQRVAFDGLKRLRRELDVREVEAVLSGVQLFSFVF